MNLAGYALLDVIYATEQTVVARASGPEGRPVVLKYAASERPAPELLARWQHEYAVLKAIDSPWVVRPLALLPVERSLVLVLEDFASTNLAQLLARHPLDLGERLALALQLVAAVGAVHAHGLIHGDISPKNVLVDVASLRIKLCDFGLSSRLDHDQKRSQDAFLAGTLEYMSPEQTGRTNLDVDYRSDYYALGVSLYELFGGRRPFQSSDPMSLLHAQIASLATPLHELDPAVPPALSAVVHRLLAKHPDQRYQSSYGLAHDLELCQAQWQASRRIEAFETGRVDVPERFCVSQTLYGRQAEIDRLLIAFERAGGGQAGLLLVSGYSGIGKTALVSELHRPVLARRGYFLRGKCDQYLRNQPYVALAQAFQHLVRQLAAEGRERRQYWKARLLQALGSNAGAVAEVVGNLPALLGELPPLPPLPAAEAESRFHIAFATFVSVLASASHPLLLFIDDLQWADAPTLSLLNYLCLDEAERCLLIVGAYRDNEVDAGHPLALAIAAIEAGQGRVEQLRLDNLAVAEVQALVADTVHCAPAEVEPLAALCLAKTRGNPFFLGQLLRRLHQEGDIRYARERGQWRWDLERIRQRDISDNVVHLVLHQMQGLAADTRELLALASLLGNGFDLATLMAVAGRDARAVAAMLWPALQAGLVLPLDEHYKFNDAPEQLQRSRYRFLHDRVQQAAYQLTADAQRPQLQLLCGRRLLAGGEGAERDARLFVILECLNAAVALIDDPAERAGLLALNLRGGVQAKAAAAYDSAVGLLRSGLALLAGDAWQTAPAQTLQLYRELAEAEYLAGHFAEAEQLYPVAIAACPEPNGKASLCLVQADQYHIQGRFLESYPILRHALALLGRDFPESDEAAGALFPAEFDATERMLAAQSEGGLLSAPEMLDEARLLEMRAYFALSFSTYQSARFNAFAVDVCRMVQTTLSHGQCDLSCIAYVGYVTAMSAMRRPYPDCYRMGRLAMRFAEQRDSPYFRVTVYQYFTSFYQHWCEPLEACFGYLDKGAELGMAGINQLSGGYCALMRAANKFAYGTALDELELECERGIHFLRRSHQGNTAAMLIYGVWLPVLALRGRTLDPLGFDTAEYSASTYLGATPSPSIHLALYLAARLRHGYLFDDAATWRQAVAQLPTIGLCLPDSPAMVEGVFYAALGLLRFGSDGAAPATDLAAAEAHWQRLREWAVHGPDNFRHKALLVEAELARVRGEDAQAMDLFAQAIDAAGEAGFAACEALCNELYAQFWAARKQAQLARNFIRDAHYQYRRWGAEAKCRQLETQWPQLKFRSSERIGGAPTSRSLGASSQTGGMPDLNSLLKAGQLLASEIHLDRLLNRMLGLLLENAGAEYGAILLCEGEQLSVEVAGGSGRTLDSGLLGRSLEALCADESAPLPAAMLEYTQLARSTLLLDNPVTDSRFAHDGYLQRRQPKSALCLPVVAQGQLLALVYLENNLLERAFTRRHQQTLELLSAQAAISLVNARLYESLEEKVRQRTEELRQMSMKDGLTGIANRRSFDERLGVEWRRGLRSQLPLSLLMIDIDHFKQYNDHYGHLEGDRCIQAVASVLVEAVNRPGDLVARYGGEEFVVLLPETGTAAALGLAEACMRALAERHIPHASSLSGSEVSMSIGLCTLVAHAEEGATQLVARADEALYAAKRAGRRRCMVFTA